MTGYSGGILGDLCVLIPSRVKNDWIWSFRMLALSLPYENVLPSFFKDATPTLSVLWCLMKDQNRLIADNSFGVSSVGRIMDSTCCQWAFRLFLDFSLQGPQLLVELVCGPNKISSSGLFSLIAHTIPLLN